MRKKRFATAVFIAAMSSAATVHARGDGPRFAQDRLDALVAHHAEANRHIARARHDAPPPKRTRSAS